MFFSQHYSHFFNIIEQLGNWLNIKPFTSTRLFGRQKLMITSLQVFDGSHFLHVFPVFLRIPNYLDDLIKGFAIGEGLLKEFSKKWCSTCFPDIQLRLEHYFLLDPPLCFIFVSNTNKFDRDILFFYYSF